MRKFSFLVGVLLLQLGMSSCSQRLIDFTIISSRNVPIGKHTVPLHKADKRVKGVSRGAILFAIPVKRPNIKDAVDRAIDKYPGSVGLVDGVIRSRRWSALLFGQNSYVVVGTPLYEADPKDTNISTSDNPAKETTFFYHEVKEGESISDIATSYDVKVLDIIKWNKLNSADLPKGTKLKILVD